MNPYKVRKKKSSKVSPERIIRTILNKEGLDQNFILLIKRKNKSSIKNKKKERKKER